MLLRCIVLLLVWCLCSTVVHANNGETQEEMDHVTGRSLQAGGGDGGMLLMDADASIVIGDVSVSVNNNDVFQFNSSVNVSGIVTASAFQGDGSGLINLPAGAFAMDQNVRSTDSPTFVSVTLSADLVTTSTIDGVDVGAFKSAHDTHKTDYDAKVDQDVRSTASPTFVGATLSADLVTTSTIDGVDVGAFKTAYDTHKADYDGKVNQDVRSTASPTFVGATLSADLVTTSTIDGVDLAAFKADYDAKVNQDLRTTAGPSFATVNTGNGNNELYAMDQNVLTTSSPTFAGVTTGTLNTGNGNNELYAMNQDVLTTSSPTFAAVTAGTINTGFGANELYQMNQNVMTTSNPTFASMFVTNNIALGGSVDGIDISSSLNQPVLTTSDPTFNSLTVTNNIAVGGTVDGVDIANTLNQALLTSSNPTFASLYITNNIALGGTVDGIDIANTLNQDVRTSASPTFVGIGVQNIAEGTANGGVTVDGVLLKDGLVDGVDVAALGTTVSGHTTSIGTANTNIATNAADILALEGNVDQDVSTTASPTFVGATLSADLVTTSTIDGVDVSALDAAHTATAAMLNQDVLTTSSPTFAGLTVNGVDITTLSAGSGGSTGGGSTEFIWTTGQGGSTVNGFNLGYNGFMGTCTDSAGDFVYYSPMKDSGASNAIRVDTDDFWTTGTTVLDLNSNTPPSTAEGYMGCVVSTTHVYFVPQRTAGGTEHGLLTRVLLADWSTSGIEYFDLASVNGNYQGFEYGIGVSNMLYLFPAQRAGGVYHGNLVRVDMDMAMGAPAVLGADFELKDSSLTGMRSGFEFEGYIYALGFYNPLAGYNGLIARISNSMISPGTVEFFDAKNLDASLQSFVGGVGYNGYGYAVPQGGNAPHGKLLRFSVSDFTVGGASFVDMAAAGFSNMISFYDCILVGHYMYMSPMEHGRVARMDLDDFTLKGVSYFHVGTLLGGLANYESYAGIVKAGEWAYLAPFGISGVHGNAARFALTGAGGGGGGSGVGFCGATCEDDITVNGDIVVSGTVDGVDVSDLKAAVDAGGIVSGVVDNWDHPSRSAAVAGLDLDAINPSYKGFSGTCMAQGYVFFAPLFNGAVDYGLAVRVDVDDWTPTGVTNLDLTVTNANLKGFTGCHTTATHIYYIPFGAITRHGYIARVLLNDWTSTGVEFFDVSGMAAKGYQYGVLSNAVGGYLYAFGYHDGTNYHGDVLRINTAATLAAPAVSVLDLTLTDAALVGYTGGFASGGYVYGCPNYGIASPHGKVPRIDESDFSTVTFLDVELVDGGLSGFIGGATDGTYGYCFPYGSGAPYHGNLLRIDLSDFSNTGVTKLDLTQVLSTMGGFYGGVFHNGMLYMAPFIQIGGGYTGTVARVDVGDFSLNGVSYMDLAVELGAAFKGFMFPVVDPDTDTLYLAPHYDGSAYHGNAVRIKLNGQLGDAYASADIAALQAEIAALKLQLANAGGSNDQSASPWASDKYGSGVDFQVPFPGAAGYNGVCIGGGYVIYSPSNNVLAVRHSTTSFSNAALEMLDLTSGGSNPTYGNHKGCVVNAMGTHVFFPANSNGMTVRVALNDWSASGISAFDLTTTGDATRVTYSRPVFSSVTGVNYAYFVPLGNAGAARHGKLARLNLDTSSTVHDAADYAFLDFTDQGDATLEAFNSGFTDGNGFVYFCGYDGDAGTGHGNIVRIDEYDFSTITGMATLPAHVTDANYNFFYDSAYHNGYGYCLRYSPPTLVMRIDLSDFTATGLSDVRTTDHKASLSGHTGLVVASHYLYLLPHNNGGYNGLMGRLDLNDFSITGMSYVDLAVTVGAAYRGYMGGAADEANGFMYLAPSFNGAFHGLAVRWPLPGGTAGTNTVALAARVSALETLHATPVEQPDLSSYDSASYKAELKTSYGANWRVTEPMTVQSYRKPFSIGDDGYNGAVYHPLLERVYFVPKEQSDQPNWHYFDCAAKEGAGELKEYLHGLVPAPINNAYKGGIWDDFNKRIWFVPYHQVDDAGKRYHYIDQDGNAQTHVHTLNLANLATAEGYWGCALHPNVGAQGRIYMAPFFQAPHANKKLHYIDIATATFVEIGHAFTMLNQGYVGAAYHPMLDEVILVPFDQQGNANWHKIDSSGNVVQYAAGGAQGVGRQMGAAWAPSLERLYFASNGGSLSQWLYMDSVGTMVTYLTYSANIIGGGPYSGAIFVPTLNRIILAPYRQHSQGSKILHYIDGLTGDVHMYNYDALVLGTSGADYAYSGGCLDPLGERVIFAPGWTSDEDRYLYLDVNTGVGIDKEFGYGPLVCSP